jgi:hypothetical protein
MRARAVITLAAAVLATGCGGGGAADGDPAVAAVSDTIHAAAGAVAQGNARGACRRLTAHARRTLERRAGTGCEAGVKRLKQRLPGPGVAALERLVVRDVVVHGARASALAEPPSDLVELARATGVTYPLLARVRLVRRRGAWLIEEAAVAGRR